MTPLEAATIYTDLVLLCEEIPADESVSMDAVTAIRSKYHDLIWP